MLFCDCLDHIYTGIPCRHLIAFITKTKSNANYNNLPFNPRWRIDYFQEASIDNQTEILSESLGEIQVNHKLNQIKFNRLRILLKRKVLAGQLQRIEEIKLCQKKSLRSLKKRERDRIMKEIQSIKE